MMAGKVGALVGITTAQVSLVLTPIPGTHHFKDFGLLGPEQLWLAGPGDGLRGHAPGFTTGGAW